MLVDLKRTVAYICPMCSSLSSKRISVFDFSGRDRVKLICPTTGCHEECASITSKGERYSISIECPLCGDKHTYNTKSATFWNKPLLSYKCPAAGMNVFFAGNRDEVEKAVEDSASSYSDALSDGWRDIDDFEPWRGEDEYDLLYEIVGRLQVLNDSHNLSCCCGSDDIEIGVAGNGVMLQCRNCRRSKVIELSEDNLTRLLNTTKVIIGN